MKRLAAILLPALWLAAAAAPAAPPIVVGRNGQMIVRFPNGQASRTDPGEPGDGESAGTSADRPGAAGKLRWQNGETLPGELAGASAGALAWRTPLFEEPLLLGWAALRRYDRPGNPVPVADPFAFVLRDGSHLYGSLVAITDDTVAIRSTRHGDVRLKRSELLSLRRVSRDGLPAGGPTGNVDWQWLSMQDGGGNTGRRAFAVPAPSGVARLATGPGGALALPCWNTAAFRKMALPARVDLEFLVRATGRPDFSLQLEPGDAAPLRIDTWDGDVVLVRGGNFVTLGRLADTDRAAACRICWDRPAHRCLVTLAGSARIVKVELPDSGAAPTRGDEDAPLSLPADPALPPRRTPAGDTEAGLVLENKGRDLTLELLRVRPWDGTPPVLGDPVQPGVWLADGRIGHGHITGGAAGEDGLRFGGADAAGIPLRDVDAIVFAAGFPAAPAEPAMTLTWADGTFLHGAMIGLRDGQAAIQAACAEAPLSARVDGLRQILLPLAARGPDEEAHPLAQRDRITAGDMTLHGDLSCLDGGQPRWRPVGGVQAAVPSRQLAYEIVRAHPVAREEPAAALFYTRAGDILPGELRSLDPAGVDFDSAYVEAKRFGPGELAAVQFNGNVPARVEGFSGPGWQAAGIDAAKVEPKDDGGVRLEAGGMIGHSWVMECSELRFRLVNADAASLRLRMFCADAGGAKALNLAFMRSGGRMLYYGVESADGQMESQQQTPIPAGPLEIRLVVTDQQVELSLGGRRVETFPAPLARRAGTGLVIEPASLWGNSVRPVELAGFVAEFQPGHAGMPAVNAEAKTQALTVPRFRRDDPPRQALIAVNGDVLRGELTGATARQFVFRSGLESVRVPRERVRAAVWLRPPAGDAPADAKPAVAARLAKRCMLNGQYANMRLRDYVGIILQWDADLKAKYPDRLDSRRLRMHFEQPTIGEALDQVCATFDLTYRLEGDTVVFSSAGVPPPDMRQQAYWLKPGSFPGPEPAQVALAARGLSFPEGAFARWEPGSGQIVMTNTAENQRKLAGLLRADFGDGAGGPTHWLALTDGTRLGLAVDDFGPRTITGHHPVYGRCEVPLSLVSAIRTSAPEPGPAARMFADWRLIAAPEPVLPGAGGEGDTLVGKEPKSFTLPLLGGGEFDLGGEKGKVVVLDFWATWCPPCIQSLPGLIEAMGAFPADQVRFVGVNQAEPAAQVRRFLDTRGWKLSVALDAAQDVGQQFGAESIPRTVVIGRDGKVARAWTGYQPGEETEIAETVKKLLADPPKPPKKEAAGPEARLLPDAVRTVSLE